MRATITLIAFLLFLHFSFPVFAARSLTISANKDSLFGEEELTITASASGFTTGETIYIKGAFHQDGSTNYFGYTKSGDSWIKNGESTLSQKSIQIGQWDGLLAVKSDFVDSGYNGEGGYKFKVGFYYVTSGGNPSSVNWSSNSLDININEPDPTPTPSPTPTNTPTPTPTNSPTPTPTPTPTKTPTPTSIPNTPTPTLKPPASPAVSNVLPTFVLGESTESELIISPAEDSLAKSKNASNDLQKILIFIGVVFITICGILAFRAIKKEKLTQDEDE
ncbi:MAG: hypothetical protein HY425_01685 [Candidatus Levybacteria bacterium]|nr:hypothetical protein [Candidatus Levybacteria bacterium]